MNRHVFNADTVTITGCLQRGSQMGGAVGTSGSGSSPATAGTSSSSSPAFVSCASKSK